MRTQEKNKSDALIEHIRNQGFAIDDYGFNSDTRRFAISSQERMIYFDFDAVIWNDISQDDLLRQADSALRTLTKYQAVRYSQRVY